MSPRFQALGEKLEPRYDYFRGTVEDDPLTVTDALQKDLEMKGRKGCKGPPQYDHSVGLWLDANEMETKAADVVVSYGGNGGADPGVLSRGGFADKLVPVLRANWPHQARATRIDSCIDLWDGFDAIEAKMQEMHRDRRIARMRYGVPETGQTFTLGGKSSPMKCRVYQKGLQLLPSMNPSERLAFERWTRVEAEYHPRSAEKEKAMHLSALDVWGAARWTADLLEWVAEQQPAILDRKPRMDRTAKERLEFMLRMNSRTILEVAAEEGPEAVHELVNMVLRGELGPLTRADISPQASGPHVH